MKQIANILVKDVKKQDKLEKIRLDIFSSEDKVITNDYSFDSLSFDPEDMQITSLGQPGQSSDKKDDDTSSCGVDLKHSSRPPSTAVGATRLQPLLLRPPTQSFSIVTSNSSGLSAFDSVYKWK